MPLLQDLLHRGGLIGDSRFVRYLVVFLAVILLALTYDLRAYKNMFTPEGMDSAQLARNIAEGKGYTTLFVRPFSMHLLEKRSQRKAPAAAAGHPAGDPQIQRAHPDIANPPLYPVVLAGLMKVLPFRHQVNTTAPFWSAADPAATPVGGASTGSSGTFQTSRLVASKIKTRSRSSACRTAVSATITCSWFAATSACADNKSSGGD